jgi:hypothetical protein
MTTTSSFPIINKATPSASAELLKPGANAIWDKFYLSPMKRIGTWCYCSTIERVRLNTTLAGSFCGHPRKDLKAYRYAISGDRKQRKRR